MRSLLPLATLATTGLLAVACGAPTVSEEPEGKSNVISYAGAGGCSRSREEILGSVSAARREALERGFSWLDADVPYSQAGRHDGYRTDCSGFVSMVLGLSQPGPPTASLNSATINLDSWDELVPGDALNMPGRHAVIFLGFEEGGSVCVIEQSSTNNDMQFRVRSAGSLAGYQPIRAEQFANDTNVGEGTINTCATTPDAAAICAEANIMHGVQCGLVADGCGGVIDCGAVMTFGCAAGTTCKSNKCVATCTPKTAAVACAEADAQCGKVSDGCGGRVDCDALAGSGCAEGKSCNAKNKCVTSTIGEFGETESEANDTPLSAEGDVGDPGDDDDKPRYKSKVNPVRQSAGCSAGGASSESGLLAFAGIAVAIAFVRRRKSAGR